MRTGLWMACGLLVILMTVGCSDSGGDDQPDGSEQDANGSDGGNQDAGGDPGCQPDCSGAECGNGGCADQPDVCGTCGTGETCRVGQCEGPTPGGLCDACDIDNPCEDGLTCSAEHGRCTRDCQDDSVCGSHRCINGVCDCDTSINDPNAVIEYNTVEPSQLNNFPWDADSLPDPAPRAGGEIYLRHIQNSDPTGDNYDMNWTVTGPGGETLALSQQGASYVMIFKIETAGSYHVELTLVRAGTDNPVSSASLDISVDPCTGDCVGKDCGEDGCYGSCGSCSGTQVCVQGICVDPWVPIPGGSFMMGSPEGEGGDDEHPQHEVSVPAFEMYIAEVTVAQYRACVDAGSCTLPDDYLTGQYPKYCNWDRDGRDYHPLNCVDWDQAVAYCQWAGGRLASEAEWEYAAQSAQDHTEFPWGSEAASCDNVVMSFGCGLNRTFEVCQKPAGNSAQGLCDMLGNLWEWNQDGYHRDVGYEGAPTDGSAWDDGQGWGRVNRGGSFMGADYQQRVRIRQTGFENYRGGNVGFRCAR